MKRMKRIVFALVSIFCFVLVAACGSSPTSNEGNQTSSGPQGQSEQAKSESKLSDSGDVLTLKLGHQSPESTNYHIASLKFKELVEEKSGGKVKIEVYPFRQLGSDRELLEQMQFGTLDFGMISAPPVSGFAPETAIMDLPFLFKDWNHVKAFLNSDASEDYKALTDQANIKTLSIMARGFRSITNSKGPIEKPEDLKNLKIRVIESPIYVEAYKALGTNAQSMSWSDAYTALEQGAIDAQENTLDIIFEEKVDEVQKYVSKTELHFVFGLLMASQQRFNQLPKDIQQIVIESAEEAMVSVNEQNEKNDAEYEVKLKEKGMQFNDVNKELFKDLVQPVYDNWVDKHGDELLNKIKALEE